MMPMSVAVIYAVDSIPTSIAATYAEECIRILERAGLRVDRFAALTATRIFHLANALKRYEGVMYFGHGTRDKLLGQLPFGALVPLLTKWDSLRARVLYAVACLAGQELMPALVRKGLRAGIANVNYTIVAVPAPERDYFRDFLDVFVEPVRVLARGGTAGEAHRAMHRKVAYYRRLYLEHMREWPNADFYVYALDMNSGFRLFGDPSATITRW